MGGNGEDGRNGGIGQERVERKGREEDKKRRKVRGKGKEEG